MRNYFIIALLALTLFASTYQSCGDWETFGDEKCFKVTTQTGTYERAKIICKEFNASLITIKSVEEQRFLENLVFKRKKIVNPIWIGLKFNDLKKKFIWDDNSEINYKNWAQGNPKLNDTKKSCVQMESEDENLGKWVNKHCDRSFGVVCEKMQEMSLNQMKKFIFQLRKENREMKKNLSSTTDELKQTSTKLKQITTELKQTSTDLNKLATNSKQAVTKLNQVSSELAKLKQNPVPIGFIYVQLPKQPPPNILWLNTFWNETSDQYSGLFFRVSGGGSSKFGDIQEDFSPRIVYAKTWWHDECDNDKERHIYDDNILNRPKAGSGIEIRKTKLIETGLVKKFQDWSCRKLMKLEVMNGEVRPRNTAVRIWKRTA